MKKYIKTKSISTTLCIHVVMKKTALGYTVKLVDGTSYKMQENLCKQDADKLFELYCEIAETLA